MNICSVIDEPIANIQLISRVKAKVTEFVTLLTQYSNDRLYTDFSKVFKFEVLVNR